MIASTLIFSLPFLTFGRVQDSEKAVVQHLLRTVEKESCALCETGVCSTATSPTTNFATFTEGTCASDTTANKDNGILQLESSGSITGAETCAASIVNVCGLDAASPPGYVSYAPASGGNPAVCAWFASGTCAGGASLLNGAGQVTFGTYKESEFTTHIVQTTADTSLVTDENALATAAKMSTSSSLATADTESRLSQTPEQIQASQEGESADEVNALGADVGQDQQNCPDDYGKNMKRGEWMCVKRPNVGAMAIVAGAGCTVFVLVFILSFGLGHKLRNPSDEKDDEGEEEGEEKEGEGEGEGEEEG